MVQNHEGEYDALVLSYTHLRNFPRSDEALHNLKKIASLVKPIMRARNWKVSELCEFYPEQQNLLGLNVNRGYKILLRLRYPGDRTQFLPIEQVVDTMLHELVHIVHGPHDAKFHALWDQLRDEHEGLVMKGYTGEGFLSQGYKLGGKTRVPMHEARRLARSAAEERSRQAALSRGSGRKLGGAPLRPGDDIREVITGAIERRNKVDRGEIDRGCGSTNYSDNEIQSIAETATKNGFRTQAEEDAANEAAIAQALWELVQEDEMRKYGKHYIQPSAEFPAGNGGGAFLPTSQQGESSMTPPPVPEWSRPISPKKLNPPAANKSDSPPDPSSTASSCTTTLPPDSANPLPTNGWTCGVCTLHNPPNFLSCDACGTERPEDVTRRMAAQEKQEKSTCSKRQRTTSTANKSTRRPFSKSELSDSRTVSPGNSSSSGTGNKPPSMPIGSAFWECSRCGNVVERQWWSCGQCGNIKENSK